MLTTQQLATLKTYINSVPALASLPKNSDTAVFIASELNKQASPAFTVWKTSVPIEEVGDAINATELVGLTSLNLQRLQTVSAFSGGLINPSRADRRSAFDQVFSAAGGTITRPALLALWKRTATTFEKLFATGTGSDAVPATLVLEGEVSYFDVEKARAA